MADATQTTELPPAQSTPTEKPPADFMADIVGELEQLDAGKPIEKAKPSKPAEKPPAKPEVTPPEKDQKTPAAPAKEVEPPAKPSEPEPSPKPVKAAELRTAYENLKKKVREELEPEVQRLRSKVQEIEGKPAQEVEPILQKVKALEQRNSELERRIEFVDFSRSEKFRKDYAEPYRQAYTQAVTEFQQLNVREPDGEDEVGEPKYRLRKAGERDLLRLANLEPSDMDEEITRMFGASAHRAAGHIATLQKLASARDKALEDAEKNGAQWTADRKAEAEGQSATRKRIWDETNTALKEKFPKAYAAEEGDADDAKAFTKGFALADLMFAGPSNLTAEQIEALPEGFRETIKAKKPMSDAQYVRLHALARLKMGNHDRKVASLKKALARIAELEKTVAEYEQSEPSGGKAASREGKPKPTGDWLEQAEEELKALDRR